MTERCTLCGLEPNECARITDVTASGGMRRRLLDLGIAAGTRAECVSRGLFGDPTAYLIRGTLIALRHEEAELINAVRL